MSKNKHKPIESLIVDKEGNQYVGVRTLMTYFHESRASAYRRINRDFKNPDALLHFSFRESIKVPGQRATTSGITLDGFAYYAEVVYAAQISDEAYEADLQETKDHIMKNALLEGKSVSEELLFRMLHSLELSTGQKISDLEATVDNAAIMKVTNPFDGTYTFIAGNTYDEFLKWSKKQNRLGNSNLKIRHSNGDSI